MSPKEASNFIITSCLSLGVLIWVIEHPELRRYQGFLLTDSLSILNSLSLIRIVMIRYPVSNCPIIYHIYLNTGEMYHHRAL
ncbi:hypothetical protein L873DRAFT_1328397 [Choiromyces venosus 120613-1]|uniref:Uncharacterized protein n=1 Tax=Choiromyces venosus 120613-1 TaxID=1336337 RepID=A0A3N4JA75_9PEZI|nr:hypothetical protein L873DRAFT_1328397 [Choiromyces venosus 120613-1]